MSSSTISSGSARLQDWWRAVSARFEGLTDHREPVTIGLAVAVGLITGLLAALLIRAISLVQSFVWPDPSAWWIVLAVPTLGALIVGMLITYVIPESSGSGVVQVMRTIALRGARFRGRVPAGGILASGLALATGASGGREGPIVLIGGSAGSIAGQLFHLDEDRLRTLVAAGTAAGIGASFNAPIGGMLFAIELILGGFRTARLESIVVASVTGSVTARQLVGEDIIYRPLVTYELRDLRELALYVVLGLACVIVGIGFLRGEAYAKKVFQRMRIWPPLRTGLGGLAVGVVALGVPEVLGTGDKLPPIDGFRDPVQQMLDGTIGQGYAAAGFLLLLALAKYVATCVSIGSGNAIGTFAPVIFTGAALGGSVGYVAAELLPTVAVQPGAFALVGMAAAFGATARAPLTSIVIAFELTGDYALVLPLMLATGVAVLIANRIETDTVYTHPLVEQGIMYGEPEDIDVLQTVTVNEVMTTDPDTVPASMSMDELRLAFRRSGHHGFPVVDDDRLVGIVTLTDLENVSSGMSGLSHMAASRLTAGEICTREPIVVTPDQAVFRAVQRMAALDVGRLPVVDPTDTDRLVGLVRRPDLVKAYRRAMSRSVADQQRSRNTRLRDLVGVQPIELLVVAGAPAAGRAVRDVKWPPQTVLTSIRRQDQVLVPRGDTEIEAGDAIVALVAEASREHLHTLLAVPAEDDLPPDGTSDS